jgi:hypothetical protein
MERKENMDADILDTPNSSKDSDNTNLTNELENSTNIHAEEVMTDQQNQEQSSPDISNKQELSENSDNLVDPGNDGGNVNLYSVSDVLDASSSVCTDVSTDKNTSTLLISESETSEARMDVTESYEQPSTDPTQDAEV